MWKSIVGYEGVYEVSDVGEVRRISYLDSGNKAKHGTNKLLKPSTDRDGYKRYALSLNGKTKHIHAHRIVCAAFIPSPHNKLQVNHKNGEKDDNRVENLEWVTASENIRHRQNVLGVRLTNNRRSKPVNQYDLDMNLISSYPSAKEAHRETKLSQGHISECCRGEISQYKGFIWKYV